jgi:hypothetical protein
MEMIQRGERPDDIQACLNSSCLPLKLLQEKSVLSFFCDLLALLWYRILMMTLQTLINQSRNPVWHRNPRFAIENWLPYQLFLDIDLFSRMIARKAAYVCSIIYIGS